MANGQIKSAERPRDWQIQANDDLARIYGLLIDPNMPVRRMIQRDKLQKGTIGCEYWESILDINTVRVYFSGYHGRDRVKGVKKVAQLEGAVLEAATKPFEDSNNITERFFKKHMSTIDSIKLSDLPDLELTQMAIALLLGFLYHLEATQTHNCPRRSCKPKKVRTIGRTRCSLRLAPLGRSSRVLMDVVLPSQYAPNKAEIFGNRP